MVAVSASGARGPLGEDKCASIVFRVMCVCAPVGVNAGTLNGDLKSVATDVLQIDLDDPKLWVLLYKTGGN